MASSCQNGATRKSYLQNCDLSLLDDEVVWTVRSNSRVIIMAETACRTSDSASLGEMEIAARRGAPDAQAVFAIALFKAGRLGEAIPWFGQAARMGDARAQYMLGVALYNGDGCARDEGRALGLLRAAAGQGIRQAQNALDAVAAMQSEVRNTRDGGREESRRCARTTSASAGYDTVIGKLVDQILPEMLRTRLDVLLPETAIRLVCREMDRLLNKAQASPERS